MKTHDALAVANWFFARAEAEGKTLDPMKLQKLIYFSHGWSVAITGRSGAVATKTSSSSLQNTLEG
jgi:uncharacterized phage-associated protein